MFREFIFSSTGLLIIAAAAIIIAMKFWLYLWFRRKISGDQ